MSQMAQSREGATVFVHTSGPRRVTVAIPHFAHPPFPVALSGWASQPTRRLARWPGDQPPVGSIALIIL